MAVPKRKTSASRRDRRRTAKSRLAVPTLQACPQCRQPRRPHHACGFCGTYRGREVEAR